MATNDNNRRNNLRVPTDFEITYIHKKDYMVSFTRNISADGMFVYTENPPKVGEVIKLTFSIGNLDQVTVNAKVVWVNQTDPYEDPGMGIQFIDTPPILRDAILKLVNRIAILGD